MSIKIVAISGFKGSGKDTFANFLGELIGVGNIVDNDIIFYNFHFSDCLYNIVSNLTCDNLASDTVTNKEQKFPKGHIFEGYSFRQAMDNISIKMKELFGKDVWVKAMRNRIDDVIANANYYNNNVIIILPDVRFTSEFEMLRDYKNQGIDVHHFVVMRKSKLPEWVKLGLNPENPVELTIIKKDFAFEVTVPELQWTTCFKYGTFSKNSLIRNDGSFNDLNEKAIEVLRQLYE